MEGGVFNAVISIKLQNKNEVKSFGDEPAIQAKFAGGAVELDDSGAGRRRPAKSTPKTRLQYRKLLLL